MGARKRWNAAAEARLHRLAARSHGVLHRRQILAAGMSEVTLRRRVKDGWTELYPKVYRLLPPTKSAWKQQLMAACLWGGETAAASHGAAAALHGLEKEEDAPIEISIANDDPDQRRNGRTRTPLILHRTKFDPDVHVIRVDGIPVMTPTRTLLDLAPSKTDDGLDAAMDQLLRQRQTSNEQLERFIPAVACRGRRGVRRLRRVHSARRWSKAKDSEAERLFLKNVIQKNGLPEPVHTPRLQIGDRIYKPDFLYPDAGLAIEIHGRKDHSGNAAARDAARQNQLVLAGLTVLVYWWEDITRRAAQTAEEVRAALVRAGLRLEN